MSEASLPGGPKAAAALSPLDLVHDFWTYSIDACQRSLLFLREVLQQRSKQYREYASKVTPHVLKFGCELIMDGRKLQRPVNYALVRVAPTDGSVVAENTRPFVVVDPRAGHRPGIGGFKPQSEISVALKAGHPATSSAFCPMRSLARGSRMSLTPGHLF